MSTLFDQQSLLQQVADAQATTFIVKDLEHRYLMVNQVFADIMALSIEDILGKNDLEIGIPPDMVLGNEQTGFPGFWALDDKAIAAGAQHAGGSQLCEEENIVFYKEIAHDARTTRTPLLDEEGDVVALLIQSGDLTELRNLQKSLQESLETSEAHLTVLNDLMAKMMAHEELDPLLQYIAEIMIEYTPADNALILMVGETEEFLQIVAGAGGVSSKNVGLRRLPGTGPVSLAWSTAQTQFFFCSDDYPAMSDFWPTGTQLIAEPFIVDGKVIGVAAMGTTQDASGFRQASGLISSLANLAGIAISNARTKELARFELKRMRALSEISKLIVQISDCNELLGSVSKTLMDAMDISRSSILMLDEHGNQATVVTWQLTASGIEQAVPLHDMFLKESISQWCINNNEFACVLRNEDDPRESPRVHAIRKKFDLGCCLCMPVRINNAAVGVVRVNRGRDKRDFDENEINLFTSIIAQLSSALQSNELSAVIQHQAFHDSLTQLPNRRYFEDALQEELLRNEAFGCLGAIMFLDLDGFKTVNDTFGHAFGDRLLQHVSSRLSGLVRDGDFIARIGGDEFAIVVRDVETRTQAVDMAIELCNSLNPVFEIDGASIKIGVSVGVSFYPDDGVSADDLLRNADEAMYRAKSEGKGTIVCFDQRMADASRTRSGMEADLKKAIDDKQFQLFYQAQVNTQSGCVDSVEALIRWHHPIRGFVSAAEFIPIAEECGLINRIGFWVLEEAIEQLSNWRSSPMKDVRIGVNIAASQFLLENFADEVLSLLDRHQVPPDKLEIEVTETIVMSELHSVIKRLNMLRSAGVRVAVDDFGTGYSSLSYLQDLPLDALKIDRSFVVRLQEESGANSLVNTIVHLAKGLHLETVAEGVETASQFEQLVDLGCTYIQGYFFSKPCCAEDIPSNIAKIKEVHSKANLRHVA